MKKLRDELEKRRVSSEDFFKEIPVEASYLLEYVGKLKNAYSSGDELNIIFAARSIAEICYNILRPFNPVWKYTTEKETYSSFIELQNKPTHYVEDFKTCYGLITEKKSVNVIFRSAKRLARETTDFLRKNKIEQKINDKDFLQFFNSIEYRDFLSR